MALRLCASCSRHVRLHDDACPFCGSRASAAVPVPVSRATRAALVFGGATLVVAGVACGGTTESADAAPPRGTAVAPPYGLPPTEGGIPSLPDGGALDAAGGDAAVLDSGSPVDAGRDVNVQPPYGTPPPPDAGRD